MSSHRLAVHRTDLNQPLLYNESVVVKYRGGTAKRYDPLVSFVCFTIDGAEILMASRHFSSSGKNAISSGLYDKLKIDSNIDLSNLPHGGDDDVEEKTMPLFIAAADELYLETAKGNRVLVNCNHGRSRTGSVVALYLTKYHGYEASEAIKIVEAVQGQRGVRKSIDIRVSRPNGSYAGWLKNWYAQNRENLKPNAMNREKPKSRRERRKTQFFRPVESKLPKKEESFQHAKRRCPT